MEDITQKLEEAEATQSVFELSVVDKDISHALKDLPANSIAREYPIRLQVAKSLKEIVPLLRTLVEQIKKSNKNAGNSSNS